MYGGTRPLPPIPTYQSAPGKHLTYGLNSDVGRQRSNNQDSMMTFFTTNVSAEERPDFGVFAVADGMGGHVEGEKASAITTRLIGSYLIDKLFLNMLLSPRDAERPIITEVLTDAILKANDAVSAQIPDGGTTLTAAVIIGDMLYIGHVGDSRAYLVTNDSIEQITRDHSLVQRLIELDQLTPEEAQHHSQKNVLYRAIGQSENLEVDSITRRLPPGARLLICSDGLWGQVSDLQLHEIVRNAKSPQEAVDKMIGMANDHGGPDNITALLIQVPG
jgi:serine/threonine protein phosphatase PrpC